MGGWSSDEGRVVVVQGSNERRRKGAAAVGPGRPGDGQITLDLGDQGQRLGRKGISEMWEMKNDAMAMHQKP